MKIITHANGPFMVNTYLVINESTNNCIIIDPGYDVKQLIEKIVNNNLILDAIIATHGHLDHVEGVGNVKNEFNAPFYANELDKELIDHAPAQARMFGAPDPGIITIDKNLPASGEIELAGLKLNLLHTPGHSPGSISIKIDETVFTGDALFNMSIGRTDLPGGSYPQLIESIKKMLFTLPGDTKFLSGHGPGSTIGSEKNSNPFFK